MKFAVFVVDGLPSAQPNDPKTSHDQRHLWVLVQALEDPADASVDVVKWATRFLLLVLLVDLG